MYTLLEETAYTYEIKRSKFITHIMPFERFEKRLEELKKEHPKARHFVTASRHFNKYNQIIESFSDDGEPKGTAGKPSLHVLQGHELINIAAVTIRYFGGIKLGTGGLVRAYSDALNTTLEKADIVEFLQAESLTFEVGYSDVRLVEYEIEKLGISKISKEFGESVYFCVEAPKELLESLRSSLDRVAHIPHRQEDTKSE